LGRKTIGFDKQYETVILQRRGQRVEPPKHWTAAQVELQEQRITLFECALGFIC